MCLCRFRYRGGNLDIYFWKKKKEEEENGAGKARRHIPKVRRHLRQDKSGEASASSASIVATGLYF